MNAISSSVNKGALKVTPKAGAARRTRTAPRHREEALLDKTSTKQDVELSVQAPETQAEPNPPSQGSLQGAANDLALSELSLPGPTVTDQIPHGAEEARKFGAIRLPTSRIKYPNKNIPTSVDSQAMSGITGETSTASSTEFAGRLLGPSEPGEEVPDGGRVAIGASRHILQKRHSPRSASPTIAVEDSAASATDPEMSKPTRPSTVLLDNDERDHRRQARTNRFKREATPEEAESLVLSPVNTRMGDLCKDTRQGRKSSRYEDFVRISAARRRKRRAAPLKQDEYTEPGRSTVDSTDVDQLDDGLRHDIHTSQSIVASGEITSELDQNESESGVNMTRTAAGAPQVRIVDGQIVLDVSSLQVDRALRDAVEEGGVEYVDENPLERIVNSKSYSRHQLSHRWDALNTALFYDGLSQWGTDFDMISRMFPARTRKQIKNKFTIEEKRNPSLVTRALLATKPVNIEEYSRITEIEFKSIATLEAELSDLRDRFELERQEAILETAQRTGDDTQNADAAPQVEEKKKSRRRVADDGLLVVGSIEEVAEQEKQAALKALASDDEAEDDYAED